MAVKKLDRVSDDLEILVAENNGEEIVIGNQALLLMPLTVEELEVVTAELAKIAEFMVDDNGEVVSVSTLIQRIVTSGVIQDLLAKLIEPLPKSTVKHATIPQLKHILGILWRQNLSDSAIGESARKNFREMLEWAGFANPIPASEMPDLSSTTSSQNDMDGPKSTSEENGSSGV